MAHRGWWRVVPAGRDGRATRFRPEDRSALTLFVAHEPALASCVGGIRLRAAVWPNPRIRPMLDGAVPIPGVDVRWETGNPAIMHLRHLREGPFDLFEFSLSAYLFARLAERWSHLEWIALPVFHTKATALILRLRANVGSGIAHWSELRGKRLLVPDYHMTAAIWLRVMLRELYGIEPREIEWYSGRTADDRHSAFMGFPPPPGVTLHEPKPGGPSPRELLERGLVDAAMPDDTAVAIPESERVRLILPEREGRAVFRAYQQQTGTLPVNHVWVLHRRLGNAIPGLAVTLYDALERSKQLAIERSPAGRSVYADPDDAPAAGVDLFPAGIGRNRVMLNLLSEAMLRDGSLPRFPDPATLFPADLRAT